MARKSYFSVALRSTILLGATCSLPTQAQVPPSPQSISAPPHELPQSDISQAALWKKMIDLAQMGAYDKRPAGRLTALTSLDGMTFGSANAPWQTIFPTLGHCLSSKKNYEREWAARVLADAPADSTVVLPQLRQALLDKDVVVRGFSSVALAHADKAAPGSLQNLLLKDLKDARPTIRYAAAEQIRIMIVYLWGYGYFSDSLPPGVSGNGRYLDTDYFRLDEQADVQRTLLLNGMAQALSDKDPRIRHSVALTIWKIGDKVYEMLGSGGIRNRNTAEQDSEMVLVVMKQAQKAMQTDNPVLAKYLGEQIRNVAAGPSAAY
jgi:hypothetical protein